MQPYFLVNKKNDELTYFIQETMQKKGIKFDLQTVKPTKNETRQAIIQAINSGYNPIVAVGGDGTINTAASGIIQSNYHDKINLGIIPQGTCNDLVRFLGIPVNNYLDNLNTLFNGTIRKIDTGWMNGELFVNGAGLGRTYETYLKIKKIKDLQWGGAFYRKFASYYNTLSASLGFQPLPVKIKVENQEIDCDIFLAVTFNGPYFSKGMNINAGTKIDDGFLDVFILKACPKKDLITYLLNLYRKKEFEESANVLFFRTKEIFIETEKIFWPQVDGEKPQPEGTNKFYCEIGKNKLRVIIPK